MSSDDSEDCAEPGELTTRSTRRLKGDHRKAAVVKMDEDGDDDNNDDDEDEEELERLLLPGDLALSDECDAKYVLGVGLRACLARPAPGVHDARLEVRATRAGFLRSRGRSYWLDCPNGRYQPTRGDCVLGVVVRRAMADAVQVDIGCPEPAMLSLLSFENATKRNRHDVRLGDLVYCRLTRCEPGLEPELACVDSAGRAGGFGVIGRDCGAMTTVPPGLARRLAIDDPHLLGLLAPLGPFETTVGCNGRLWLCGTSWPHTVALTGAVAAFHLRPTAACKELVADMQRAMLTGGGRTGPD